MPSMWLVKWYIFLKVYIKIYINFICLMIWEKWLNSNVIFEGLCQYMKLSRLAVFCCFNCFVISMEISKKLFPVFLYIYIHLWDNRQKENPFFSLLLFFLSFFSIFFFGKKQKIKDKLKYEINRKSKSTDQTDLCYE